MIDIHCHLEYMKNPENIISEAMRKMNGIITSIADPKHFDKVMKFRKSHPDFVFVSAGLHPTRVDCDVEEYLKQIKSNKDKITAIGETGLDYHHITDDLDVKKTQDVFRIFIQLARELKKPLVLHIRNAYDNALKILKEESAENVVIHCFTGTRNHLDQCLERGYYISYATLLCNSKSIKKRAKQTPVDRMLLETDSPWLDPNGGKMTNVPWNIEQTASVIAELKGMDKKDLLDLTEQNARSVFSI